ncbi:hypothetical protein ACQPZX_30720 [Actinoplanes sp. CA-142083]|uniref:hypothetical protein n=1 Tax=Actinoplanes sp. CA-142083 TaxID=3239903 RepID=UPI003D8E9835
MPKDDAPPLQLIVVEGGGYCDPETGFCAPPDDPGSVEATSAEPTSAKAPSADTHPAEAKASETEDAGPALV